MSPLRDGLRLAIGTLTRVPVSPPLRVDRSVAQVAMVVAPVTVLPLVALWAAAHLLAEHTRPPTLLLGTALVAVTALYSRGLHLDGLADTCDGLSASHDRGRALAVMKTGDVGPSGAAAVALVVLAQAVALGALLETWPGTVLAVVALVVSRHALAWGCAWSIPAARSDGLGAAVASSVGPTGLIAASAMVAAIAVGASFATRTSGYAGLLVMAIGLLGAVSVLRVAIRRLGGMSGDVLGAVVEITLTTALAAATFVR